MNKRYVCILIMTSLLVSSCQQENIEQVASESDSSIVIGRIDKLNSTILNEERELWVYLPSGVSDSTDKNVSYPVLYLLDGSTNFHAMSAIVDHFSSSVGNGDLPEMIIVGLRNTDRMRDLTPTHTEGTTGGGDKFLDFIEHEAIPYIEQHYSANQYRTFVGHSLGGLIVVDTLLSRPHLFANYVAIDPSLWWDEQVVLREAQQTLGSGAYERKSLYLAAANTISEKIEFSQVMARTDEETQHIRSILEFAELAESTSGNGLNFEWKYYPEDSHGSVPLIAEYDAMRFLFSWYQLEGMSEYFSPESGESAKEFLSIFKAHYENSSAQFGYVVTPPEIFTDNLGRQLLASDKPDHAFELFTLNLENYPQSHEAHASMGDYFNAQSDSSEAIRYYSKAVELGAGSDIQEKISELEKGVDGGS